MRHRLLGGLQALIKFRDIRAIRGQKLRFSHFARSAEPTAGKSTILNLSKGLTPSDLAAGSGIFPQFPKLPQNENQGIWRQGRCPCPAGIQGPDPVRKLSVGSHESNHVPAARSPAPFRAGSPKMGERPDPAGSALPRPVSRDLRHRAKARPQDQGLRGNIQQRTPNIQQFGLWEARPPSVATSRW